MRRAVVVAVCLFAALAPGVAAAALDVPTRPARPGGPIAAVDPVFTADGGVVFGAATTPTRWTIYRLEPGASEPRVLLTLQAPAASTFTYLEARLIAAGPGGGFVLDQHVARGLHAGSVAIDHASLTLYRQPGSEGIVLPDCDDWGCSTCSTPWTSSVAADGASVLVAPLCPAGPDPMIYDIATGAMRDVPSLPDQAHIAGSYVSGTYPGSDGGGVVDTTTGKIVRTAVGMTANALLPDGTLFFEDPDSAAVMRLGPGDTAPVATGAQGVVADVAAGRLLTATDASGGFEVWTLDGASAGKFTGISGAPAFDGARIAFLERSCMTVRLQIWEVGAAPPERLAPRCGTPTAGVRASWQRRVARIALTCPATDPQGCMGTVQMVGPRKGRARTFALRAGQTSSVPLASGLGPRACRQVQRARRWGLRVMVPTVFGSVTKTVSVGHDASTGCPSAS